MKERRRLTTREFVEEEKRRSTPGNEMKLKFINHPIY